MEKIDVHSFREFEDHVAEFRAHRPVWRGQRDARWKLETTLERFLADEGIMPVSGNYPFADYFTKLQQVAHFLGNSSGLKMELPSKLGRHGIDVLNFAEAQNHWEDLVQLRHHDFPSFFLDWTQSPWVALFFAFQAPGDEERAVYVNLPFERAGDIEYSDYNITTVGFPANTQRHRLQQCFLACAYENKGPAPENMQSEPDFQGNTGIRQSRHFSDIVPFEKAIQKTRSEPSYKKMVLPADIRKEVLSRLSEWNINHFTLFGNPEAAVRTAALNTFVTGYFTH